MSERVPLGPLVGPLRRLRSIPTRRSLLPPPADRTDTRWQEAWRHLFDAYVPAMRAYVAALLRAHPPSVGDPEDVVQGYLATCLEKGWLDRDAKDVRCFRAYLQTQLRRFTHAWVRDRLAAKRTPERPLLDAADHPPAVDDEAAVAALDEALMRVVVDRALATLRAGNEDYAEVVADLLRTDGEGSPDLAARLRRPPAVLAVLRHRARKRFAALLAEELRATVRGDEAFEALADRLQPYAP